MIKNNGCCDLKYAKKLKELGVKQESLWWWCDKPGKDVSKRETRFTQVIELEKDSILGRRKVASAFTVAELGELLPANIQIENCICTLKISKNYHLDTFTITYNNELGFEERNMADAMAEMFIWLIEQGKCLNIIQKIKGKMPKVAIGGKS